MSVKLGIKRIIDSCKSKDDVHFYKVEWNDCWLHQDVLTCWKELIENYKKTQELKVQVKQENGELNNVNQESCTLCNLEPDTQSLPEAHTTNVHAAASSAQQISNMINKKSRDEKSFFLLSPNTVKLRTAKPTGEGIKRKDSGTITYSCWQCGMKFKSFKTFKLHQRAHEKENGEHLICITCKKRFTSLEALNKHKQLHTSSLNFTTTPTDKMSNDSELSCKICQRKFTTKEALDVHTKLHVNLIRKFNATSLKEILNRSKKNFENRKTGSVSIVHRLNDIVQRLPIPKDPGSAGPSNNHLNFPIDEAGRPEEGALAGVSEFTPEVLENARHYIKAVSKRRKEDTLRRIIENQTQEEPIKHSAHTIGVDVELNRSEESIPIIGKEGERYFYQCKLCAKKFYNKFHHREHFNVHSGEMPYECEFCHKRFAQRSGWNRHIKLHHKYEVFEGPIPYSHSERSDHPRVKRQKLEDNHLASAPTMATTPLAVTPTVATQRFVPIAPYPHNINVMQPMTSFPAGAIPLSPAILSPDRFPKNLENALPAGTVLIRAPPPPGTVAGPLPPKTIQILQPAQMTPTVFVQPGPSLIPTQSSDQSQTVQMMNSPIPTSEPVIDPKIMVAISKSHEGFAGSKTLRTEFSTGAKFQCKKVKTMDGRVIFMIRVIDNGDLTTGILTSASDMDREKKSEFAYILDPVGQVEARIFVSDHPGGDWVDFPLDNIANGIMLERIQCYDDKNRRGPKPRHYNATGAPSSDSSCGSKNILDDIHGKEVIEKALINHNGVLEVENSIEESVAKSLREEKAAKDKNGSLVTHGRSFRSGKEKKFTCNVCSRKFLAQAHLNDHMLIHTGEFPFKCMFCSRPFRHKSGLNSHHKRHIQNGVFDRPISCKEPNKKKPRNSTKTRTDGANQATEGETSEQSSTTKSKRKGRPLKRKEAIPVTDMDQVMFKIKEEDLEDSFMLDNEKRETVTFDVQDVFECNFCVLTFPTRTAYLKHVNNVHKNPVTSPISNGDPLSDGEDGSGDPRYIQMSDFENTLLDMGAETQPSDPPSDAVDKISTLVDGMIPIDQIKEETPDY